MRVSILFLYIFFIDPPTTEIYTLSLHDALPISGVSSTRHTEVLRVPCQAVRPLETTPAGRPRLTWSAPAWPTPRRSDVLAHVPAQQGARYGRPSAQAYPPTAQPGGYQSGPGGYSPSGHQPGPGRYQPGSGGYQPPTTPGPAYGDGWDTPTHTVSS